MRSGATLLLIISLVSSGVPIVYAQLPRVGEITLTPAHAVSGTLVSFQGIGWYLPMPYPGIGRYSYCIVDGVPVKIDRHCICNVLVRQGIYEPTGTFTVKDVPPGTYSVFVEINPSPAGAWLTGAVDFAVDPITTETSTFITTFATSMTSHTEALTTSAWPTLVLTVTATVTTTETESPSVAQARDYTTVLAPLSIVAICLVVILAVVLQRKRPPAD
jgi:hypothetical protein